MFMKDFIKWMTGSKTIPPFGSPKKFTINFTHGCKEGCRCRPTVSTCDIALKLPVHINSEEEMIFLIKSTLKDCQGFGKI